MTDLRQILRDIAAGYSAVDGGTGQSVLNAAISNVNPAAVPAGWVVKSSRRIGQFTTTPWVGFFDPDETTDPKTGLYVCWIFEADLQHVVISIQQGTESLAKAKSGDVSVPAKLASDAKSLRAALGTRLPDGLTEDISFGLGARQVRYAAGSIAHRRFEIRVLPEEEELIAVQQLFCGLLAEVVAVRNAALLSNPGKLHQSAPGGNRKSGGGLEHFKPKSALDYIVHSAANEGRRHRRHEAIVNGYSEWASARGWTASSPHPVDLRLRRGAATAEGDEAWSNAIMFEAKVVYQGNATQAVRAVIGQLTTYPFVVLPARLRPGLRIAALFSESIGDLWLKILEDELRIATVWWEDGRWVGGNLAHSLGLAEDAHWPED